MGPWVGMGWLLLPWVGNGSGMGTVVKPNAGLWCVTKFGRIIIFWMIATFWLHNKILKKETLLHQSPNSCACLRPSGTKGAVLEFMKNSRKHYSAVQ
jgi:hypothetical protein